MKHLKTYYWSDSMEALTWIKTKGSWNTFVGNRVKEINSCSDIDDWYHVPGDQNLADIASRGCTANILIELKWWEGPQWLKHSPENWPHTEIIYAFSSSLRRFIARRGRVSVIYSDNGTNFIGAKNYLKKIDWNKVMDYSTVRKIKWHQNPPTAAWWGGW
ncbi:uncharacterized protein [Leptinotarsa decemlineata]|uniref:uncharacterized protein n=1 Tax=Leptinotarsa decemlineata TaxID=7539 RepID=UPI003D30B21B